MAIPTLAIPRNYANDRPWNAARVDEIVNAIEAWSGQVAALAVDAGATETVTGWTLTNPLLSGAGVGLATLQYANSGNNRTITFPDPGGNDSIVYLAAAQTLTNKTITLNVTPVTANTIGASSNKLTVGDGTTAQPLLRTDTYAESSYNSVNISIGTTNDGAFADVDATNAKITFTVNCTGRYLVNFLFAYQANAAAGAIFNSLTSFRLTDSSTNSNPIEVGHGVDSDAGSGAQIVYPVNLSHVFNFGSTGSKTVKLQKQNITSTNISSRAVTASADSSITMRAHRIAD